MVSVSPWSIATYAISRAKQGMNKLTGQPAQVQLEPQPQEPEEAHPQPDMMIVCFGGKSGVCLCVLLKLRGVCGGEKERSGQTREGSFLLK